MTLSSTTERDDLRRKVRRWIVRLVALFVGGLASMAVFAVGVYNDWPWYVLAPPYVGMLWCLWRLLSDSPSWMRDV